MPQRVQIDGVGVVEFSDDFTPAEIKGQVGKLYRSQTYEGQLEDRGLTEEQAAAATVQSDKKADLLAQMKQEQRPSFARWLAGQESSFKGVGNAVAQSAVRGLGHLESFLGFIEAAGIPNESEGAFTEPGAYPRLNVEEPRVDLARRVLDNPTFQEGRGVAEVAPEVYPIPENEKGSLVTGTAEAMGSFLPLLATGPLAPATIGAQSMGEHLQSDYENGKRAGLSDEAALGIAIDKGMASGLAQGTIFSLLPKPLKSVADKYILSRYGAGTLAKFVAQRGTLAAEGAALGGTSTAAENAVSGRPVMEGTGEGAAGLAALNLLMPPYALPSVRMPVYTPRPRAEKPPVRAEEPPKPAPLRPEAEAERAKAREEREAEKAGEAPKPPQLVVGREPGPGEYRVTDELVQAEVEARQAPLSDPNAPIGSVSTGIETPPISIPPSPDLPVVLIPPSQPVPEVPPGKATFDAGDKGTIIFDPRRITPEAVSEAVDNLPPPAEPTQSNEPGQPTTSPPGVDVREPTGTGEATPPVEAAPPAPGPETPGGTPVGASPQGQRDERGGSVPGGAGNRPRPAGRRGPAGPPAGPAATEGPAGDLPQPGGLSQAAVRIQEEIAALEKRLENPLREPRYNPETKAWDYVTGEGEPRSTTDVEEAGRLNDAKLREYKKLFALRDKLAKLTPPPDENHILPTGEDWIPSGDKSKVRANLDAIALLKKIEAEGRGATPEEKAVLARYTGWGGLKQVFDEGKAYYRKRAPYTEQQKTEAVNWERDWGKLYDEVKGVLTPEEHAAAARSILNAHYTSRDVINNVWKAVQRLGFKGGRALEPAAGVGNFIGLTPEALRDKTRWSAVELDSTSARIAQRLYPQAQVANRGFEKTKLGPNQFDLVISNVPFAAEGPRDSRYPNFSLHNYFFARALDLTKPGGIVAAITSDSTMDSTTSRKAREFFGEKADLVGAIRLPNTAFKKNAGTEVTTDVLFFRKRDGTPFKGEPFLSVVAAETYKGEPIELNEYFAAHPEMMLGRMSKEGTMYGPDQQALLPTPGADLNRQFEEAIARLPQDVMGGAPASGPAAEAAPIAEKTAKLGGLTINGGVPLVAQPDGTLAKPDWAGDAKKVKQAVDYVAVRDAATATIRRMLDPNAIEASIALDRAELNKRYDNYVKKHGQINERRSQFLDDDVDFPLALALEDANTRLVGDKRITTWSKSKIFTERTLFPRTPPERVDSVPDAMQVSQNFKGRVEPDYIAKLTGQPVDAVKAEMEESGQAFENPDTGLWENRATYLSGFVKKKLAAAQRAAESDPRYARHVAELTAVQPPPIAIENIGVRLGSVFIPPAVIQRFLADKLHVNARVHFTEQTGDWKVVPAGGQYSERNKTLYGIHDWKGHELVEQALNLKSATVTKLVPKDGGGTSEVKDAAKSLEAQQKQDTLQKEFKDYVRTDPDIAHTIEGIYNERYNGVVSPKFEPPTWAHYPGASADIQLREHQKAVVTRMLQNSTLLAHAVGTGKTYAMTTAAMEMRRLGLAKKPMIVVQNATLEQFARSFKRLYPTARILAPNAKQRDALNRNKTMSRIATGDWDAVIIPQSFVNMLPDNPAREQGYIQKRLDELAEAKLEAAHTEGKKSPKAADLQRAIDRLKKRLEELAQRKQDNVLTFEQLGVDALFVDEAHAYKKLEFTTKMDNIKGLDTGASQRGWSMSLKTRWVQEQNQGRNVTFATGTPVSNTIAEAWNMMRYVRPDVLKAYGIEKFDDFASTFGDSVTQLEMTPGGTWKPVTRFARYTNGPELIAAWRTVADVVTPEEINLPGLPALKNGRVTTHTIQQSPPLKQYVLHLRKMLEDFAAMSGKDKRANSHIPLVVFGLAKKASLDMRMIDPAQADQPNSKLNTAADAIAQIYRDSTSVKGAQMVFSDAFQNDPDNPQFNLYQEVKKKLIERGVPESQIAIITSEIKDAKREALFAKVNDGDMRVVLGSTERMGVGVNAQEHMIALHHLDAPARPMDIEQRNGRILRQGNQNPEVEVHTYGVENTLDAAMFQKLATKQKFINQILRGDLQGRNFEDAANEQSLTFEEQMAAFSGDKRAMEKVGLENQVRQLESLRSGHAEQLRKARETMAQLKERTIPYQQKELATATQRAARFGEAFGPDKDYTLKVGDATVTGRKEVAAALDKVFKAGIEHTQEYIRKHSVIGQNAVVDLGKMELNGQQIELTGSAHTDAKGIVNPENATVLWKFTDEGSLGQAKTGAGFFHSLAAALERIESQPKFYTGSLASEQRNLRELAGFVTQPFEREGELAGAKQELARLNAELEAEGKTPPPSSEGGVIKTPPGANGDVKVEHTPIVPPEMEHEMGLRTASGRDPSVDQYVALLAKRDDIIGSFRVPEGWRIKDIAGSRWESVYWIVEDPDGETLKLRVANHGSTRTVHGPNDYEVEVPKNYTLAQFRNGMRSAENWLSKQAGEDAAAAPKSGGAGIKTRLESEADKGGMAALQPRASALTSGTPSGAGGGVNAEVEHGFSGSTTIRQAAAADVARIRNMVAPQTGGAPARFAGNLLRELNARMANELARADVALRKFRRDFDRTPVNVRKFKYDPTVPLPRNFAFIDAYETGNASALHRTDQLAAAELHHLNVADVARVQALGTGALTKFYTDYFPHIWEDPKRAAVVIGQLLAKAPLEGPKSFLKQRTHQLFREGLEAGLKPVHDNPVDLWLLKKREIERYILAHNFTTEMRNAGLMKFKYAFAKAPDGWTTVNDRAFAVYGPPTVTIKEAFDAGMREATLDLLKDLGVPHERLTRIGGKRWGFERDMPGAPGSERITTKFAGPDFVIWHELGHVLHNRYRDLEPLLTATDQLKTELRALGDARTDASSKESFRRYVRSMPEKMAVVLQAYVHAPEKMMQIAPTVKAAMDSFIAAHPELAKLKDIRPGLRLGEAEGEITHGGLLKLGDYVMPEAAARVVNNFLSPGLNPHLWYRTLRQTSNLLNGVQLGLSAFHLGFTSLDAATSRLAVALEDVAAGKPARALATLLTVPVSPFTNVRTGAKLRSEVLRPGTAPHMAALARALEKAGGRVGQDAFWQTEFTRRMVRAWHQGGLQWATLPLRAPLAAWEQTMRPILEYVVPRQKLGVFADLAKRELLRLGPTATEADTRAAMAKAWDSVDNRMGQVVYDNLFHNRMVKDVALLAFRAYGWQLGKYREGIGAAVDTARAVGKVAHGERPEFTHRMAYAIALPLMVGTIGGVMHYLMTGQQPQQAQDYFQPMTGEVDRNGNPVRLNLPSYVKDAIAYAKHPVTSLAHSLNPLLSSMFDLLANRDFYNTEIRHPDDPLWRQGSDVAQFAAKQFVPFSVSGAQKLAEEQAPAWKRILPYFGVTPVPLRLTMSPSQELAAELMAASLPAGARTKEQFDEGKARAEIVDLLRRGQKEKGVSKLKDAVDARTLTGAQVMVMMTKLKWTPYQFQVHMMSSEDAMRVWRIGTPQERQQITHLILGKLANSKTLSETERVKLGRELLGR